MKQTNTSSILSLPSPVLLILSLSPSFNAETKKARFGPHILSKASQMTSARFKSSKSPRRQTHGRRLKSTCPPSERMIHFSRELLPFLARNTSISRENCFCFSRELLLFLARITSCSREDCKLFSRETLVALAGLAKSARQASFLPLNPPNLSKPPRQNCKHNTSLHSYGTAPLATPSWSDAIAPRVQRTHDLGPTEHFTSDIFAECGEIAAKMKFVPGPGTLDCRHMACLPSVSFWRIRSRAMRRGAYTKILLLAYWCEMVSRYDTTRMMIARSSSLLKRKQESSPLK